MLRQILIEVALFLLPFLAYAIRAKIEGRDLSRETWREAPLAYLAIAGLVLVAIGLAALAILNDDATQAGGRYVPTHFENGKLVPGQFQK